MLSIFTSFWIWKIDLNPADTLEQMEFRCFCLGHVCVCVSALAQMWNHFSDNPTPPFRLGTSKSFTQSWVKNFVNFFQVGQNVEFFIFSFFFSCVFWMFFLSWISSHLLFRRIVCLIFLLAVMVRKWTANFS